jgi:pyruvate/2-oxoglutarate dehydrogenase complex dihydrolipoamide acyltransferase (E2) component
MPTVAWRAREERIQSDVPMSSIRRKTAEHLVLSKRTSAHVSAVFEID